MKFKKLFYFIHVSVIIDNNKERFIFYREIVYCYIFKSIFLCYISRPYYGLLLVIDPTALLSSLPADSSPALATLVKNLRSSYSLSRLSIETSIPLSQVSFNLKILYIEKFYFCFILDLSSSSSFTILGSSKNYLSNSR